MAAPRALPGRRDQDDSLCRGPVRLPPMAVAVSRHESVHSRYPQFDSSAVARLPTRDPGRERGLHKDVWAVARDGRARVVRTIGTPLFAAFSLDGTTVGVVTGARRGYLLAPMLTVKWSGNTSHIPVRWPSQVGGVGGEGGATFARAQVEQLLGALMWGWGVNDDVSDDGQWRAVTQQEPRGPGPGSVEFFGPHADGFHGRLLAKRPRWSQAVGCPSAELSADAEFVIVTGDFKNPTTSARRTPSPPWCSTARGR
jgi:hypothetical protein